MTLSCIDKYEVFTNLNSNDNIHMINQTVDAEIKVIMIPQRAGDAENPAENKSSNGPLRVQSNAITHSILQREGMRYLPGI